MRPFHHYESLFFPLTHAAVTGVVSIPCFRLGRVFGDQGHRQRLEVLLAIPTSVGWWEVCSTWASKLEKNSLKLDVDRSVAPTVLEIVLHSSTRPVECWLCNNTPQKKTSWSRWSIQTSALVTHVTLHAHISIARYNPVLQSYILNAFKRHIWHVPPHKGSDDPLQTPNQSLASFP